MKFKNYFLLHLFAFMGILSLNAQNSLNRELKKNDPCAQGILRMNRFRVNCPTESFTVSGSYSVPEKCQESYAAFIRLDLATIDPNTGLQVGVSTIIAQDLFNNLTWSFTIDPNSLNLDPSFEYSLGVSLTYVNGYTLPFVISPPGREITFNNCTTDGPTGCQDYRVSILDEYIDGTQSGSNSVFLMANGNFTLGAIYTWTITRQNGSVQTYTGGNLILVDTSFNNRIVSATVNVSYEDCEKTANKIFRCAIPNADANGNLFPECDSSGGGFGRTSENIKISPNPVDANASIQIHGIENMDIEKVDITDMLGNTRQSNKTPSNTVSIKNLDKGIYFVKIFTKQGIVQKKIIVK
jgi:hypothetical protein